MEFEDWVKQQIPAELKEQAQAEVKKIQDAFDELVNVCNEQKAKLKDNAKVMGEAEEHMKYLSDSAIGFADCSFNVSKYSSTRCLSRFAADAVCYICDDLVSWVVLCRVDYDFRLRNYDSAGSDFVQHCRFCGDDYL